jgi:hypothetical protein
MKDKHGADIAQKVIRFRLSHLREMTSVSGDEDISAESQAREVRSFDVYYDREEYEGAKAKLAKWKEDMPRESACFESYDGDDAIRVNEKVSPRARRILI